MGRVLFYSLMNGNATDGKYENTLLMLLFMKIVYDYSYYRL